VHLLVFLKPLQRQSVPLVYKVFNEKTVAALKTLQQKLSVKDGTILFVSLISNWFKVMNVKDKLAAVKKREHHGLLSAQVL
jgi:hypothetical protein